MSYTIYNIATGQVTKSVQCQDNDYGTLDSSLGVLDQYVPPGYYINDGVPTMMPIKPTAGSEYYFDYATKTWQLDPNKAVYVMRALRDTLLNEHIDPVNPVWYNSLTAEQQQELQTYRQALLDVPDQSGFPTAISWPTKPTWL